MKKNILTHSIDFIPWWARDFIRKIPILSSVQRLFFDKFLAGKNFIYKINAGPAKGLNFPVSLPNDKLIWAGTWEKDVAEVIAENIIEGEVSLDIGSHRGFMAGVMAMSGSSQVYCFEPNPKNIAHLEVLKKLNSQLALKIMPYAISDKEGNAEFFLMPDSSMGKLSNSRFQEDAKSKNRINVRLKTLDGLIDENNLSDPNFIKIDVEGAELQVLQGAKKLIKKNLPVFVIELHSFIIAHECIHFLSDYGYVSRIIQRDIDLNDESNFKVCHLLARIPA